MRILTELINQPGFEEIVVITIFYGVSSLIAGYVLGRTHHERLKKREIRNNLARLIQESINKEKRNEEG